MKQSLLALRSLPVDVEVWVSYRRAARILRRKVGPKAPSPEQLMQFELKGRCPKDIAGTYLDYLRDLERRRVVTKQSSSRCELPRHSLGRSRILPVRDPTLN